MSNDSRREAANGAVAVDGTLPRSSLSTHRFDVSPSSPVISHHLWQQDSNQFHEYNHVNRGPWGAKVSQKND